jgi:predicted dinucleotide-binding enzyme
VLIAVPYTAMEQIAKDYGPALATKQLVFDVSNPIPRRDGDDFVKKINDQGGAGVASAKMLPGAHVVRAFNAIGSGGLTAAAHRKGEPLGVPITGDDAKAIELASALIKELGFEPVLIGGSAKGKYLVPGTPLGGEHTPAEIRKIAAGLS